jgi:hypothetical protein
MCSGTEGRLQDCTLLRTHNCAHSEDSGVECISKFHVTQSYHIKCVHIFMHNNVQYVILEH